MRRARLENVRLWQSYVCLMMPLFLSACVHNGQPNLPDTADETVTRIYFVENRSVDSAIRKDFELALELLETGKYQNAVDVLNRVVSGTENNSAPYINLGIAHTHLQNSELAEENFLKALAINPQHPVANNELALFYRSVGRFEEARALYEKVLAKYPDFLPVRRNYGILCDLYLNDIGCALQQYEAYSLANPTDESVKIWIATLRQKLQG